MHNDTDDTTPVTHRACNYTSLERAVTAGALKEVAVCEIVNVEKLRCGLCQWRCVISEGRVGHCKTVVNYHGKLHTTIYGVVSSAAADPIEKKPVFHFSPGSVCFSVGTLGCNFRCVFCQNWQIAYADGLSAEDCTTGFTPEKLVDAALRHHAKGVAWTYNEPAIWLNYTLDCAKLCRQHDLYTVYVTNGYATPEALDAIGPYLDVYRVDIKSMEDSFYRKLIKIPQWRGILEVAQRARHKWGMHVECVTNVIPGYNDGEGNLRAIARWIADALGNEIPWHVTRFFPYGELSNVPPTPQETLEMAVRVGREEGLMFVYLGNISSDTGENTYCPKCGSLAVRRSGYTTEVVGLDSRGRCTVDGEDLNIRL